MNFSCELGSDLGTFAAGAASNKIAAGYMDEMVETAISINSREELNARIFKIEAQNLNVNPELVRGTGFAREFVPIYMQGDICDRPERNARPKGFEDDDRSGFGSGITPNPNQDGPSNTNGGLNFRSDSNVESSDYPTYPTQPNSEANSNESIFDRFCGLFGFGGGPSELSVSGGTGMVDNSLVGSSSGSAPDSGYSGGEELGTSCWGRFFDFMLGCGCPGDAFDMTSPSSIFCAYIEIGCDPTQCKE